jgi:hypothetical protein
MNTFTCLCKIDVLDAWTIIRPDAEKIIGVSDYFFIKIKSVVQTQRHLAEFQVVEFFCVC